MSIKLLNRVAGALAAVLIAAPCLAADKTTDEDEATDEKPYMEEIIVTATFRETNLMDTPIAITVLDENTIIDKGIFDVRDMYLAVPGLAFREATASYNGLAIRGMVAPTQGASVMGVYVDDTPVTGGRHQQISGAVFDVARVEVLKGPQGTLFGEGAMGGTLRYITNRPDPQARTARVKAEYSHMDESDDPSYVISGVVNVPLDDRLALRVSGQYRDRAGYMDALETRNEKDVNWRQDLSIRARIESVVSDKLVVNGSISYYDGEYGGPSLAIPVPYDRPYETRLANKNFHDRFPNLVFDTHWSYNLAVNWDLGFADLLSSTSIFERDSDVLQETSPNFIGGLERWANFRLRTPAFGETPNPLYDPAIPDGTIIEAGGSLFIDFWDRTVQEFRLTSNTTGPWQWTAGLYFKDEDTREVRASPPVVFPEFAPWQSDVDSLFSPSDRTVHVQELAAYGEATYAFNEQLELTLGIRTARITSNVDSPDFTGGEQQYEIDETFLAPKVALVYRPIDSLMLYATVAQGFRPGLINHGTLRVITDLQSIAEVSVDAAAQSAFLLARMTSESDEATNYEVGIKGTLADGRVRFTGAVYRMDWKDMIVRQRMTTVLSRAGWFANAGLAHTQGIELSFDFAPTDQLTLHVGGSYIDEAQYDRVEIPGLPATPEGTGGVGTAPLRPGARMPLSPEYSINAAVSYRFLLGEYPAMARLDWYAVDEQFEAANNRVITPGYEKFDGRVRVEDVGGWQIAVFGKNLLNKVYAYEINRVGYNFAAPRTLGISVQRQF